MRVGGSSGNAHYVGTDSSGKNNTVHDLDLTRRLREEQCRIIWHPIGLKFGAKTPAELATAIVAELIDVRYKERYSDEARERHEQVAGCRDSYSCFARGVRRA